jgi:molybdate transport system substrate-binding protein
MRSKLSAVIAGCALCLSIGGAAFTGSIRTADAAEIKVLASPFYKPAYNELVPVFEKSTGNKVLTTWAGTPETIKRIGGREVYDLVIIWNSIIDQLIKDGHLVADSRVDLIKSGMGVAVRAGAPKINISSADALKQSLIEAKSIACSTGPSGRYLLGLFQKWGVTDQLKPKLMQIPTERPVGEVVAAGEAEVGIQQASELLAVKGIDVLGPLPPDIQEFIVLSAALHKTAPASDATKALVRFLTSPQAVSVIKKIGWEPG